MFDYLDFSKLFEWFGYPRYLHKRLDIGHYQLYKFMTNEDVFYFISTHAWHIICRNTHEFQETDDKLCILWEQTVKTWNEYEEFLDEELPILKLKKQCKNKFW